MKTKLSISTLLMGLALVSSNVSAQIYRCTDSGGGAPEYINNTKEAQTRGCKTLEGGNVTVIQGLAVQKAPARVAGTTTTPSNTRADGGSGGGGSNSADQKMRDSDTRSILEAELKKAEAKLLDLNKEYNSGEPEKQGIEGRNYQRYLDRVTEMKDNISRNQSDIAGLKREISRLPVAN